MGEGGADKLTEWGEGLNDYPQKLLRIIIIQNF